MEKMEKFRIISEMKPKGDQIKAIEELSNGIINSEKYQTLLGVTGSGKTFTIANVIERVQKPTLILAHNKTLAAQLCSEFKEFFPNNAVEFFVSYYDYYQPEAYLPSTDTFIEKDSQINDEIDKLRHSATTTLFERRDVIIVSSVSCIYGLGDPEDYSDLCLSLRVGMEKDRNEVLRKLIEIQYERNNIDFHRGTFRVNGDVVDVFPANSNEKVLRIEFFGDEIDRITEIDPITGEILGARNHIAVFPASHYATTTEKMKEAIKTIEEEMKDRVEYFKSRDKLIEAQRIEQRTNYDMEMMNEVGFCQGIENYSRHISGREAGSAPYTLLDYFPDDFLLVVDESHVTLPQVRGMFAGDKARKTSLIDYGFRLLSAFDNRPLNFPEFMERVNQAVFVSATPADYEKDLSNDRIIEQVIRPTGLIDPEIFVKPIQGQIDDLLSEINIAIEKDTRVLITTLTKRMAEDLTKYFTDANVKVKYLHSDIATIERTEIIRDLRIGEFDVLIGINLLREGLDLPEVSLVAILDADKQGFLRSESALVQTIGRAARNSESKVIMYADVLTAAMENSIKETNRRREIQMEYNEKHGIIPLTIRKDIRAIIEATARTMPGKKSKKADRSDEIIELEILKLTEDMNKAAKDLQFERAAELRDKIKMLRNE